MGRSTAVVGVAASAAITIVCASMRFAPQGRVAEREDFAQTSTTPKKIAGLRGFESVSSLVYDEAAHAPHRLIATYVFPDRARWFLSTGDDKVLERQMRYRSGERVFSIDGRSTVSYELEGEERTATLRQLELRRATMLWPDGFDWKISGAEARADAGALGTIVAQLEPQSGSDKDRPLSVQPVRTALLDRLGTAHESFRNITWREIRGRRWPATSELWLGDKRVWSERYDSVDTAIRFVDSYFLPPDRRESPPAQPKSSRVQHLDLPATVSLRVALQASDWEAALAECARIRDEWSPRLSKRSLELESKWTIEIGGDAAPTACILRLIESTRAPPPEFTATPARSGVGLLVEGIAGVTPVNVSALDGARPKSSKPLAAYVRFEREQFRGGPMLIVMPVVSDD